ncbi:interferon-induced very large GTPase 1-like protein [Labeo rohita]|uniref:Interferon-induced very large GTPase 1-like protein n=1 Tax=Labeo rohita TaxID=84645 RepID=A0A498P576_LABRO|nr:interferon-induced very large GTPase 1-like protein [Labeo rohita]
MTDANPDALDNLPGEDEENSTEDINLIQSNPLDLADSTESKLNGSAQGPVLDNETCDPIKMEASEETLDMQKTSVLVTSQDQTPKTEKNKDHSPKTSMSGREHQDDEHKDEAKAVDEENNSKAVGNAEMIKATVPSDSSCSDMGEPSINEETREHTMTETRETCMGTAEELGTETKKSDQTEKEMITGSKILFDRLHQTPKTEKNKDHSPKTNMSGREHQDDEHKDKAKPVDEENNSKAVGNAEMIKATVPSDSSCSDMGEPSINKETREHSMTETRETCMVNFANYKAIVSFVNIKKAHWEFLYINAAERMSDLRIVLLGWSVSENSHVGNFILGRAAFHSEAPPDVVERVAGRLKDRHVIIINSPQLLQTNISDHQITQTMFKEMEREKQEQQMKILMDRLREREEEIKKLEEEKERMKIMMEEERQNQDKERKRREEELKREISEQEKNQRVMRDEMRQERETFRHEIEELRKEKENVKNEKEKLQNKCDTEIERLMNKIENERKKREVMKEKEREMQEEMKREREEWEKQKLEEKTRREEEDEKRRNKEQRDWDEFNHRLKVERERMEREKEDLHSKHEEEENKMKILMEKLNREREELMKKQEEEKERMKMMMEEERQNQDKERKRREEKLTREITEQEKHRREIQDEMRQERETLRQMRQEKEKLQIRYEKEIDILMNRIENERKKREEEYIEREERYKKIIKEKEEKEREISEMNRERDEWEKQRLEERIRREEDEKRIKREKQIGDEQIQIMKSEMEEIIREKERIERERREQLEDFEKRLKEERNMREDQQKSLEDKLKLLEEQHEDELKRRQVEWRDEYEREKDEMMKKICSETNQISCIFNTQFNGIRPTAHPVFTLSVTPYTTFK